MTTRRLLIMLTLAAAALLLAGCPSPERGESGDAGETPASPRSAELAPLEVDEEGVRAADRSELLGIGDVPDNIQVDDETGFGATERFREASVAPDATWFAVVTGGVAHSAAWLVEEGTREPMPAAFQYGGSITIGPWSEDGHWVVFLQEGPAGDRTLTVVHREAPGETVEERAMPVRSPDHEDLPPEERSYEALAWKDGKLLFRLGDKRWGFDPASGEVWPEG